MKLFCTIDDRIELLPFFLAYYRQLGVNDFIFGVWNGQDNPIWKQLTAYSGRGVHFVESVRCDYDEYCGVMETPWFNEQRNLLEDGEWYCVADLDEFHWFGGATIPEMIKQAQSCGCHAVGGFFLDRIAREGFPRIPKYGEVTLDETFPLCCHLARAVGCGTSKIALARKDVQISSGHHYCEGHPVLEHSVDVHHFKWNLNVVELLHRRHLAFHKQGLKHAAESSRYIELFLSNPNWRAVKQLETRESDKIGI